MKKLLTSLLVLVVLAVAVPTFAAMHEVKCPICYGSKKCRYCLGRGKFTVYNFKSDEKGRKIRVPPYHKKCYSCYGQGKCNYCHGKGKVTSRY